MTSTCASAPGPAPIPIVGICRPAGDLGGEVGGQRLQHECERARLLELMGLLQHLLGGFASALHPVATEPVHRLGRQAHVRHDGDPDLGEAVDQVRLQPLELDGVGAAFLDESAGVAHAVFQGRLVRHERQIADDHGVASPRATTAFTWWSISSIVTGSSLE